MELISKLLFWVANSLLIPDIIILLCLFVRSLILIGGTYNMYIWVISAICSTIRPVQITQTS